MHRRSNSMRARVRAIEEAAGAGSVTLKFSDGASRGFHLSRNDSLQVLIASFDIAREARNPDARPSSTPAAIQLAKLIGRADEVVPHSRLWETIANIVRDAEKDEQVSTIPATPESLSGSK